MQISKLMLSISFDKIQISVSPYREFDYLYFIFNTGSVDNEIVFWIIL